MLRRCPARLPPHARPGLFDPDHPTPLEDEDHWYRITLEGSGARRLRFNGLATIAEVYFDDELVLRSGNMFLAHEIDVELSGRHELAICFRALAPRLAGKFPRDRWRPRIAKPATLRFFRTTLLGRALGWSPPIACIGPWRAIEMIAPGPLRIRDVDLRTTLEGTTGILDTAFAVDSAWQGTAAVICGGRSVALRRDADGRLAARLEIPDVAPWWPHTHRKPALHGVSARIGGQPVDLGRVGFRRITVDRDSDGKGFGLEINDVPGVLPRRLLDERRHARLLGRTKYVPRLAPPHGRGRHEHGGDRRHHGL